MRRPLVTVMALLAFACSPPAPAGPRPADVGRPPPPRGDRPGVTPTSCSGPEARPFGDPVVEADRAVAAGDFRVFMISSMWNRQVPEIYCPASKRFPLQSRGGRLISDTPDACGRFTHADVSDEAMSAFNGRMAATPAFQAATGCRPSTYCEEAYDKDGVNIPPGSANFDPRCPRSRNLFLAISRFGSPADLQKAIAAGARRTIDRSDANGDPARAAVIGMRLDNLKVLAAAGEKVGRDDLVSDAAGWSSSERDALPVIQYLVSRGADPTGGCAPGLEGHSALQMAVVRPSPALFDWLMAHGADPAKPIPCNSVTAVATALNGATMWAPSASAQTQAAIQRRMAIRMIQRGGVAKGADFVEMMRRKDKRTLSVLIAAWRREGTEAVMMGHLRGNAQGPAVAEMLGWVEEIEACKHKVVEFVDDRARLCAGRP